MLEVSEVFQQPSLSHCALIYCFMVDFFLLFVLFQTNCDINYLLFIFYSMVGKYMTQWQKFLAFWQQACHVEIYITLHFSVLMIEYLVATSYELWVM